MSLEQEIAANTAAIEKQAQAMEKLTVAFAKLAERAASLSGPITAGGVAIAEVAETTKPAKKEAPAKVEEPVAEPEVAALTYTFDEVKKAFLTLAGSENGRAKCEGVLVPFGFKKLSEAKEEHYAGLMAAIEAA